MALRNFARAILVLMIVCACIELCISCILWAFSDNLAIESKEVLRKALLAANLSDLYLCVVLLVVLAVEELLEAVVLPVVLAVVEELLEACETHVREEQQG
jgi:hypothetical protein